MNNYLDPLRKPVISLCLRCKACPETAARAASSVARRGVCAKLLSAPLRHITVIISIAIMMIATTILLYYYYYITVTILLLLFLL